MSEIYISREKAIDAIEREYGDDVMGAIKAKEAIYSVELADCRPVAHDYPVNCCPCCTAIMDK